MKKFYSAPELEMIRFSLRNDILTGSQEGAISSQIVGDDDFDDLGNEGGL